MQEGAQLPPQAVIRRMVGAKLLSRCVSLAAELGIADLLAGGPREVTELAAATQADAEALYRVLRTLAGAGVFDELPDRRFAQNALSEALRSGVPGSMRNYARWFGHPLHWRMVAALDYSVRTGEPSLTEGTGKGPFEVLAEDAGALAAFNDAMSDLAAADGGTIVQAYDFTPFARIVDVGGGHGVLATFIARAAPHACVTVFDLPHVIAGAEERLAATGAPANIDTAAGSFLERVPAPADLCVLRNVLLDWRDEQVLCILGNCRAALRDDGRVLVCELLVVPDGDGAPARLLDIEMLVGPGGRLRTEAEFAALFEAAGLRLLRVVSTASPLRLLEGAPA